MSEQQSDRSVDEGVVTVRVVGVPMAVYLRASEHGDELMREFALFAAGTGQGARNQGDGDQGGGIVGGGNQGDGNPGGGNQGGGAQQKVPMRLTALVQELRARFSGFTLRPESELAEAAANGVATIDVAYAVPRDAAEAAVQLADLLDEADEFCRAGDLLTLASPPEAVDFRRWFLGEFARQIAGHPPTPWSDWKR